MRKIMANKISRKQTLFDDLVQLLMNINGYTYINSTGCNVLISSSLTSSNI